MIFGDIGENVSIEQFIGERQDAEKNAVELGAGVVEGKEIQAHLESHAVVALVVGELDEGQNLLDRGEETLFFRRGDIGAGVAPFREQLLQVRVGLWRRRRKNGGE